MKKCSPNVYALKKICQNMDLTKTLFKILKAYPEEFEKLIECIELFLQHSEQTLFISDLPGLFELLTDLGEKRDYERMGRRSRVMAMCLL